MLFSRSRSVLLLAAVILPAVLTTACKSSAKTKPEVRLARTMATNTDPSAMGAGTGEGANGFAAAEGWQPGGAPPAGSFGADGSVSLAGGNGSGANGSAMNTGTFDETGSLANSASTDGIENAQLASELEMVHFDYDSAEVSETWKPVLNEHAAWMQQNGKMMVLIEGHCDEKGTEEYNVSLGQRRADAIRTYMVEQGVDANRISTISYGKMRPMNYDGTPEGLALNRRGMFLVYQNTDNTVASAPSF